MTLIGIDEVGRGCWAGPLVAGAVLLLRPIEGLTDSKALTAKQRNALSDLIYANAQIGLGWVSAQEVDEFGLTKAVSIAMHRAVEELSADADDIVIDGNYNYLPEMDNTRVLIKADLLIPSVSAASIVAKFARDAYMQNLAKTMPEYGFDSHVGYGTKAHIDALHKYGVSNEHRKSYKPIKALLQYQ